MSKYTYRPNPRTQAVWEDLDQYREFCRDFGYVFNEADVYRRETSWGLFQKYRQGKYVRNNWHEDAKRMRGL